MNNTILRDLKPNELFPHAYQQDLLKIQSEHFVNESIENGTFQKAYENFPQQIISQNNVAFLENTKPPHFLIGTYIKNNWKIILLSVIAGGVIWYVVDANISDKKKKEKIKNQ